MSYGYAKSPVGQKFVQIKRKASASMMKPNCLERRPIDPPPIIQLKIKDDRQDPCQ